MSDLILVNDGMYKLRNKDSLYIKRKSVYWEHRRWNSLIGRDIIVRWNNKGECFYHSEHVMDVNFFKGFDVVSVLSNDLQVEEIMKRNSNPIFMLDLCTE